MRKISIDREDSQDEAFENMGHHIRPQGTDSFKRANQSQKF